MFVAIYFIIWWIISMNILEKTHTRNCIFRDHVFSFPYLIDCSIFF